MFRELLHHFEARTALAIDVQEVADFLVKSGCQDSIIFHPEQLDPGELRGMYVQYTTHPGVYSAPDLVTLVIYPAGAPIEWQRVICCKELVHVSDGKVARTNTREEIDALVEKLLGPLSSDDFGLADIMASVDRIALYQGLALLFPWPCREIAMSRIATGDASVADIAAWAMLPRPLVDMVLGPEWPEAYELIKQM